MISKILLPISFIVLLISFWNRNDLAEDIDVLKELGPEPIQIPTNEAAFSITVDNISYQIQPQYQYELYGLVVSYRHHNSKFGLHKLWNDHLNIADVCVVWGQNAFTAELHKLNFWNGQFTCNVKTNDTQAWNSFDMFQISNNHLLSNEGFVRDRLQDIKIGDQIKIQGWLSNYSNNQGGSRNTSTTRKDAGNHACETIYVKDIQILQPYNSGWRTSMVSSLFVFLLSLVWYFVSPVKPR